MLGVENITGGLAGSRMKQLQLPAYFLLREMTSTTPLESVWD